VTLVHWSWLLVGLAIVDLVTTGTLVRAAIRDAEPALRERAIAAVILTVAAWLFAGLALAFILGIKLPDGVGTAALLAGLLIISLPQIVWWAAYRRGQFS